MSYDALMLATEFDFRPEADKAIVVITDTVSPGQFLEQVFYFAPVRELATLELFVTDESGQPAGGDDVWVWLYNELGDRKEEVYWQLAPEDDSEPTSGSSLYSAPFALTSSAMVKAKATKNGYNESDVASAMFVITSGGGDIVCGAGVGPGFVPANVLGLWAMGRTGRRRYRNFDGAARQHK